MVYHVNDSGKHTKCFTADAPIFRLMMVESKNMLVTITTNLMLAQHNIAPSGDLKEVMKVNAKNRKIKKFDVLMY